MSARASRNFTDEGEDSYRAPSLPSRGETENRPSNSRGGGAAAAPSQGSRTDQEEKNRARYYRRVDNGAASGPGAAAVTPGAVAARGTRRTSSLKSVDEGIPSIQAPRPRASLTRPSQEATKANARASGAAPMMPGAYTEEPPSDDEDENRVERPNHGAAYAGMAAGGVGAAAAAGNKYKDTKPQLVERVDGPNLPQSQTYEEPPQFIASASREVAVAAHVVPDEQDIEKQVQARVHNERDEIAAQVQQQLMGQAVHAEVLTEEDQMNYNGSDGRSDSKRRKRRNRMLLLGLVGVLVVVGVVVVLVVVLGKKDDPAPPPAPPKGEVRCGASDTGIVSCAVDDKPLSRTVTLFSFCTEENPSTCQQCVIFLEETIDGIDPITDPQCRSCAACGGGTGATEFDCTNLFPNDPCAKKDCDGNCIGGNNNGLTQPPVSVPAPSPTEGSEFKTPPGTPSGTLCSTTDEGDIFCGVLEFPRPRHVTGYFGCTENNGVVDPFQCRQCSIWFADSFGEVTDAPTCGSCATCGSSISFDCSNLNENDQCAEQDCNGNCIGQLPPPTCGTTNEGASVCFAEDNPGAGYVSLWGDCTENNGNIDPHVCGQCFVVVADSLQEVTNTSTVCNSCTPCGNTTAFNCLNVEPNNRCAATDCSGNCIGGTDNRPSQPPTLPPTPPPTGPAAEKRMLYQAEWTGVFKNSNGQALCEQPTTGVIASCGNGGKIELFDTSDIARCNKRSSNDIFCSTVRPPTQDGDFLAVVYSCTGTSTSAWTTRVDDVPDGTVECTAGGVTGTRIWIGQWCANSSERNYNLIQCDPPQAQQEVGEGSDAFRTCLTINSCPSGNCTLSTPDVAAFIPESEISESCLSDPQ